MRVQLWHKAVHRPFQLIELKLQFLEAVAEQISQTVFVHNLHKHTERLLFGHMEQ